MSMSYPSREARWLGAVSLTAVVLGTIALSSCSRPYLFVRTINEEESRYVRFQARYGQGQDGVALKFAHPMAFGEPEWAHLLDNIFIQEQQKLLALGATRSAPRPAFDEDEKRYLAKHLAEGFQKARPDEWVVFYLSHPREPGVVEIHSGGFFIEEGRLHLILANYRQPVSMAFIRKQIWNDPLRPAGDSFYDVIPQDHQTVQTVRRKDLTQSLLKQVSELSIDYSARLNDDVSGDGEAVGSSIEDRLRILKRLRDRGLISEEQFRMRQEQLLEHL